MKALVPLLHIGPAYSQPEFPNPSRISWLTPINPRGWYFPSSRLNWWILYSQACFARVKGEFVGWFVELTLIWGEFDDSWLELVEAGGASEDFWTTSSCVPPVQAHISTPMMMPYNRWMDDFMIVPLFDLLRERLAPNLASFLPRRQSFQPVTDLGGLIIEASPYPRWRSKRLIGRWLRDWEDVLLFRIRTGELLIVLQIPGIWCRVL